MLESMNWKYILGCTAVASSIILLLDLLIAKEPFTLRLLVNSLIKPFLIMFLMERLLYLQFKEDKEG